MSSDRVDLRHWRTFLAVVDQGSFTRAGEALHVTQPAVSLLVKRLEKHCGLPVLDRSGKRVIVTPVGQALAEQARRLLAVAGETEDVVRDLQGLRAGQVTVAASTLPGTYLLPPALAAFGAEWPKVSVRVALDDTRVAQQRVLRNEVDFGVMGQTQHPPGLTAVPYATDELVLVVARTHRLAQRRQVGVRDLAGLGFVGREGGSGTQQIVEARLATVGVVFRQVMEFGSVDAVKQAVMAGLGAAIVSEHAIRLEVRTGRLRAFSLPELDLKRTIDVVYRKDKRLSPAARELVRMLLSRAPSTGAPR